MTDDGRFGLGRLGLWTFALDGHPATRVREAAAEIEELGYGALWYGEAFGRDSVSQAWLLLSATRRLTVAAGIANIGVRDPVAMAAAERALNEAHPGRYLLGLGGHRVDDTPLEWNGYRVPGVGKAVGSMTAYLDAMDSVPLTAVAAPEPPRRVLAALGPKMLRLAAERTLGAHPYFVTVEHTHRAREIMGPGALLAVELAVVLDTDRARAREVAQGHAGRYAVHAPHQRENLRRLGFTDAEISGGNADRLTDGIVAYGDLPVIAGRVKEHLDAGADHVCLQVLTTDPATLPLREWRELAALI
ncbi:LLM class F420-dependent oxidoreductase [Sphaerisporangium krabiense]|uniref:TIGR03620 family F420-dependent LLM class oxidoreductase n=1 Tax=Sphaerisporangium krabiense TaxID=763782 RepID=UPI0019529FE8|nr:TIGR03620 family F420-dependent LLM class oxidoreductase [Sphaerisporangium krabiense]GII64030.1 LLM class F420-dependent oxidoreductase [Sphaerisporangium krabiense]